MMGKGKKKILGIFLAAVFASSVLSGCGVSKERLSERESAIAMMESGDYNGAIGIFENLIGESNRVGAFEKDILKYRAEAEFQAGDFSAAAHTYGILGQIDQGQAEYEYLAGLSLARAGDPEGAREHIDAGKALDPSLEKPGYDQAMKALAESYETSKDQETAAAVYEEMIAAGRQTTDLYNRLSLMMMEQEDYGKALEYIGLGLALPDDEARKELCYNEAVCYEYLGDYGKALELFETFVTEFGSDADAEHEIAFLTTR